MPKSYITRMDAGTTTGGPLRRVSGVALGAITALWLGSTALAQDASLDLIVDRTPFGVEVFFRAPGTAAEDIFDFPETAFLGDDGGVDFDTFRTTGTMDVADAMFAVVSAEIGGQPAEFEALSLMVHPFGTEPEFDNPLDGIIAIEICAVPLPDTPLSMADTTLYAGYLAPTDTPDAPTTLAFPYDHPTGAVDVRIREFHRGDFIGEWRTVWTPGQPLRLAEARAPETGSRTLGWILVAGAAALLATLAVWQAASALRTPTSAVTR